MKRNFLSLVCFSGLLLSASVSQAIYIDPYVGLYASGSGDSTALGSTTEFDLKGKSAFGLRLGWSFAGLAVGVDYQKGSVEQDTAGTKVDNATTLMGAFVDYDFPVIPIRVYGAYILNATLDPENSTSNVEGTGMKVGAGFTGLPFVSINLDYTTLVLDKMSPASAVAFETNSKLMMLSVSVPLNL